MNKILGVISGLVSMTFAWLIHKNKKLQKKNWKLESAIDEKDRNLRGIENEILQTAAILKKQAEIASNTSTTAADIDEWLSGRK